MADFDPTKDGITPARPTPSATPAQKAVEKAVGLDAPSARTSIPISAKEAAIQSAQPIEEFTGNVKRGGVFNNTPGQTGYRPVGPKAPKAPSIEPTLAEKMSQGAAYAPPKVEPTMGERMAGSAKYVPPKVDPYTGEAIKEGASFGARAAEAGKGIISGFKGAAKSVLAPIASAAPILNVVGAQQANEAALGRNVSRLATGQESSTGAIAQEAALQFMRDPTLAMKALQTAAGPKPSAASKAATVAPQPLATAPTTQQPDTQQPQPKLLSEQAEAIPAGGALTNGATVGSQEPVVDFSQRPATVPLAQGQTEAQRGAEIETSAREKGQAVSKGSGGNFRYVQGQNGQVVKQNTDSGEVVPMSVQGITGNISTPGEESPLAREARTRKETAFRDALMRQAFQPIDANTNVADVGTIKRNRLMAQQLLEQMDRSQQAGAQLGMEEKKLASTERLTAATQEQNRLAKEADQRIRDRQAAATEKQADIAARAEERKASEKTYLVDGKAVKMTDDRYKQYQTEKARDQFFKTKTKKEGLSPEEAEAEYATVVAAQSQVAKALADPKNADKRDAIKAAYRKATGLDYIE